MGGGGGGGGGAVFLQGAWGERVPAGSVGREFLQ